LQALFTENAVERLFDDTRLLGQQRLPERRFKPFVRRCESCSRFRANFRHINRPSASALLGVCAAEHIPTAKAPQRSIFPRFLVA
jgi:hypothetical protein